MRRTELTRRDVLGLSAVALAAAHCPTPARADDRPPVTDPRATDGDARHEPDWAEQLTLTVGPDRGDLAGRDDKAIQAALDYVARLGGGTVRLLPGSFVLRNAVFLPSGVRLAGSGSDSVLTKVPSRSVALADDSDWYDREITLADAGGFRVGDGVVLRGNDPDENNAPVVLKRTLVARSGNRFRLDAGLRKDVWIAGRPTCSSMFPLLTAERAADVVIENLALDGDRANNERLDGNYAGCIFLQDCNRFTVRDVVARNYHGDGISFQVCHDVVVERCHCHDNADRGIHPGSGSQRPLIRGNRLERNGIGLFWCWGVRYGLAEGNRIDGNRDFGISIGHRDTDNLIRDNDVTNSGRVGILFRDESRGRDFWPNRNRVEGNRVVDSGDDDGIAIDVRGKTKGARLVGNVLRETRGTKRRVGIRIAAEVGPIEVSGNRAKGFAKEVDDRRVPEQARPGTGLRGG